MKKLLCYLLCLMMILPAAFSLADDSNIINEITVYVTPPEPGTPITAYRNPKVTIPSGSHYMIEWAYWSEGGSADELPDDVIFEDGKEYIALVIVDCLDGYNFKTPKPEYLAYDTHGNPLKTRNFSTNPSQCNFLVYITAQKADPEPDPEPQPSGPTEKVTLSKLKSVKLKALSAKKIEVKWKKLSKKEQKKIQKIEIQYSTDKTFKTYKTKWAKKTKSSVKISGLKKNTKYWVRIRAYKKSGNIIYVSKWVTKSKKTKKK